MYSGRTDTENWTTKNQCIRSQTLASTLNLAQNNVKLSVNSIVKANPFKESQDKSKQINLQHVAGENICIVFKHII